RGTSQHVLIAGKTGSGKSTLMHILITNLAMHYSPDEVQFYLIDFKKGVEFKAYAANDLPHARVIAIESDREFGLSVLQRLDVILKERGDLFRDHGVQDIAALRNENPDTVMPRLLLFIDEFQEFFTEDDRISQQAALLLDRLVRQGRAFGIHILLGSQTLGGAYSLARSTLGQVAVRVALQCSESDAHLILSEENTAARLLTRPGEAIYNDANGLLEGNHPFQIAWLDDEKRDACLRRMVALATEHQREPVSPIVFEGNIPADPLNNRELCNVFREERTEIRKAFTGWLGEAVAIKPHTDIRFRRLSGSNLLVIGQSPNAARGILSTLLLGTVAQMQPLAAKVTGLNDVATGKHPGHGPEGSEPNSETVVTDQKATEDVNQSAAKLDAMKSFSFAGMQVENPLDAAPATGRLPSAAAGDIAQCYILDGSLADDEEESFWPDLVGQLPHRVRVGGPRQAAEFVRSISAEIQRRGDSEDDPPIVLIIDNLGRFRELRRTEDDFGFGTDRQREATPARLFVEILKSGPPAGVHTVVWADTFNNAGRWMTSQTMRELEMRVAFQMSATDSSNFIDTPIAGK
ncbi:MAG: FtsK/SpoIIIE domain-containing protein, partial [Planctomycetaceae bacterium]